MKTRPDPLAAILAEMRADAEQGKRYHTFRIGHLANRIEAAAERKCRAREQAAADYALGRGEDIHADRCRNCTARTPGNAAAMREALDSVASIAADAFGGPERYREAAQSHALSLIAESVRAALSVPARNCDRYRTTDEAFDAFFKAVTPGEVFAEAKRLDESGEDGEAATQALLFSLADKMADWLFAPAEGGAE